MSDDIGVKATFSVCGEAVHQFDSSDRRKSPSQAAGVGQQGAVEGTDKYDHRYTGRHDHGTLPALKTGGPHEELVNALLAAKDDSDAFLTGLIDRELAPKSEEQEARDHDAGDKIKSKGALGGGDSRASEPEAMELCGAGGGAKTGSSNPAGDASPPTPPAMQPAKRSKS